MDIIEVKSVCEIAVITLKVKRLDASIAPAFKLDVLDVVGAGEPRLVLDLDGVEFIDSSGLGALVAILKSLGGLGAMTVCNVSGSVLSLFRLTRMDKVFSIVASRDEAIAGIYGRITAH